MPGLELFFFFSAFQQATNFSIRRPEGAILLEFIEKYLAEGPVKKVNQCENQRRRLGVRTDTRK